MYFAANQRPGLMPCLCRARHLWRPGSALTGHTIFGRPHAARIYEEDMIICYLNNNYFPPIRLEVGCLVPCHVAMACIGFGCDQTALLCAA